MGLIRKGAAALAVAGFLCAAGLSAAPRLRLVSSTVGPVSIAQGTSGSALQTQTVEAYNVADGALNLGTPSSSVPWIVPAPAGAQRACSSQSGLCTPVVDFQGVLDNATFVPGDAVAPGDIVAVKGQRLSMLPSPPGTAPPISTQVADTQVLLNGVPIPLYFTSYGQINCQIPADAPTGTSTLQVKRTDGQVSNLISVEIVSRAPRILLGGVGLFGAITFPDTSRPMPDGSFPGVVTHPAKPGDTLIIYAIGLGPTSPFVATGQAAPSIEPLARLTSTPVVTFGGGVGSPTTIPLFAGLAPGFAGLYQMNVTIPDNVPKGNVYVSLAFDTSTSNSVLIYIQ